MAEKKENLNGSEVNLDRVYELLRVVIELLWNKPDGMFSREIMAFLPEMMALSDFERRPAIPSHMPRYEKIVRLSTIPLVNAGWLLKSNKGRWSLTASGREACRKHSSIKELYTEALRILDEIGQKVPVNMLATEEAEELAWEQVQKHLMEMSHSQLLGMIMELLKAIGYHIIWIAPSYKDRGRIDMVAGLDPLGVKDTKLMVQVIHNGQSFTMESLQSFLSGLRVSNHGLVFSSGGFTKEIREKILEETFERVTIWDMENLYELWIRYYDRLDQNSRSYLPIKAIYFLLSNAYTLSSG